MSLKRLDELYDKMNNIPDLNDILIRTDQKLFEYESESGNCEAFSLKSDPDYGIVESKLSAGCKLKLHKHPEGYEILIVLSDGVTVHKRNEKIRVPKYGYIIIEKDEPHFVTTTQETKIIGITVPKDSGYP